MHDVQTTSTSGSRSRRSRRALTLREAAVWLLTFAGFPLGSVAARLVAGPVDGPVAALVGGFVSGAVLGAAQAWALGPHRPRPVAWVLATALGLAAGLAVGAAAVGYATDLGPLVVQGAICGGAVGLAQAVVLRRNRILAVAWPIYLTGAWALGWAITTSIGVEVDLQFTVFGSAGAITVAALTLVLPATLNRTRQENRS
jgi:hypothetical protein